jgi:GNAT superfamily N-acetyltransferase
MIQLTRATAKDAKTLSELSRTTFIDTFAAANDPEDMKIYVNKNFGEIQQLAEINDPERIIEIAWSKNKAIGFLHLKKGKPESSIKGASPVELLRLYVDSNWHGKGIGALLMNRAIEIAKADGFKTLWLGVWEKNFRAQSFYKKFGFTPVGQHFFLLGNDLQTDLLLSLSL